MRTLLFILVVFSTSAWAGKPSYRCDDPHTARQRFSDVPCNADEIQLELSSSNRPGKSGSVSTSPASTSRSTTSPVNTSAASASPASAGAADPDPWGLTVDDGRYQKFCSKTGVNASSTRCFSEEFQAAQWLAGEYHAHADGTTQRAKLVRCANANFDASTRFIDAKLAKGCYLQP